MFKIGTICRLYWKNIKLFCYLSFMSPTQEAHSVTIGIKLFVKIICFIPSVVLFPILWTVAEINLQNTIPKQNDQSSDNNKNWEVKCDDDPINLGANIFNTMQEIVDKEFMESYDLKYHAVNIFEKKLLIYTNGQFIFIPNNHENIVVETLLVGIRELFNLAQKIIINSTLDMEYRYLYAKDIYKYFAKECIRATIKYLDKKGGYEHEKGLIYKIHREFRDWVFNKMSILGQSRFRPRFPGDYSEQDKASRVITTFLRKIIYLKKKSNDLSPLEYHNEDRKKYEKYLINFKQAIPLESRAPNKTSLSQWVEDHGDSMRDVAEKFAKQIRHRSWQNTEKGLADCITRFNKTICSYHPRESNFVIVVPNNSKRKSNHFMTSIAMQYLDKEPFDIKYFEELDAFIESSKELIHLLFIDDASYSGKQLNQFISRNDKWLFNNRVIIHVVVVSISLQIYQNIHMNYGNLVVFYWHELMLSMSKLQELGFFTEQEYRMISAAVGESKPNVEIIGPRTLFYFDHTTADDVSTFPNVFNSGVRLDGSPSKCKFVPQINFSYKKM